MEEVLKEIGTQVPSVIVLGFIFLRLFEMVWKAMIDKLERQTEAMNRQAEATRELIAAVRELRP